jgi:hypothetical protein
MPKIEPEFWPDIDQAFDDNNIKQYTELTQKYKSNQEESKDYYLLKGQYFIKANQSVLKLSNRTYICGHTTIFPEKIKFLEKIIRLDTGTPILYYRFIKTRNEIGKIFGDVHDRVFYHSHEEYVDIPQSWVTLMKFYVLKTDVDNGDVSERQIKETLEHEKLEKDTVAKKSIDADYLQNRGRVVLKTDSTYEEYSKMDKEQRKMAKMVSDKSIRGFNETGKWENYNPEANAALAKWDYQDYFPSKTLMNPLGVDQSVEDLKETDEERRKRMGEDYFPKKTNGVPRRTAITYEEPKEGESLEKFRARQEEEERKQNEMFLRTEAIREEKRLAERQREKDAAAAWEAGREERENGFRILTQERAMRPPHHSDEDAKEEHNGNQYDGYYSGSEDGSYSGSEDGSYSGSEDGSYSGSDYESPPPPPPPPYAEVQAERERESHSGPLMPGTGSSIPISDNLADNAPASTSSLLSRFYRGIGSTIGATWATKAQADAYNAAYNNARDNKRLNHKEAKRIGTDAANRLGTDAAKKRRGGTRKGGRKIGKKSKRKNNKKSKTLKRGGKGRSLKNRKSRK